MRFTRHRNGMRNCWYAYGDGDDPITEVTGVGGYTGEIFPCNGDTVPRPICAGSDGKPCGRLHGYTGTTQHPRHPEVTIWGHGTRDEVVNQLVEVRRTWAEEIRVARGTEGAYAEYNRRYNESIGDGNA